MSYIRVLDIPQGPAPLEIRKEWQGVLLPLSQARARKYSLGSPSTIEGKSLRENAYIVPSHLALKSLQAKSPNAAEYWRRQGYQSSKAKFLFKKEICQPIATSLSTLVIAVLHGIGDKNWAKEDAALCQAFSKIAAGHPFLANLFIVDRETRSNAHVQKIFEDWIASRLTGTQGKEAYGQLLPEERLFADQVVRYLRKLSE